MTDATALSLIHVVTRAVELIGIATILIGAGYSGVRFAVELARAGRDARPNEPGPRDPVPQAAALAGAAPAARAPADAGLTGAGGTNPSQAGPAGPGAARSGATTGGDAYKALRSNLGRSILLGLELLVAADIINTVAVQPTLESIAVLAGIVAIRTFLSFSLELEIEGKWPWQGGRPRK